MSAPFCANCGKAQALHLANGFACKGFKKPSGLFAAYAAAHGRTSAEQWAVDTEAFAPHPLAGLWGWLALRRAMFETRVGDDYALKDEDVPMFECWLGVVS